MSRRPCDCIPVVWNGTRTAAGVTCRIAARVLVVAGRIVAVLGAALILIISALVTFDVLGRELFGRPLPGVPELVSLSILLIVFLAAPEALARGRLTRTAGPLTALGRRRPRLCRVVETAHDAAGAFVFATVAIGTAPLLLEAVSRNEFVGAIGQLAVPVWPVRLAVLSGSIGLALCFVSRAIGRWRDPTVRAS